MFSDTLKTLAIAGAFLAVGCGSETAEPVGSGDPSATAVLSVTPDGGATNVDPSGPFSFAFNGAMMPGMENYVDLHRGDITGPVHPMSCVWSLDFATLTCTPRTLLGRGTRYTLHLGGGVRGANGTSISMDPGACGCTWVEPGRPGGQGMDPAHTRGETHGGHAWTTMDPGWHHETEPTAWPSNSRFESRWRTPAGPADSRLRLPGTERPPPAWPTPAGPGSSPSGTSA